MNIHTLKDLRDYHQRIVERMRSKLCVREGKATNMRRKSNVSIVSESERFLLRDHERFVQALDEVIQPHK